MKKVLFGLLIVVGISAFYIAFFHRTDKGGYVKERHEISSLLKCIPVSEDYAYCLPSAGQEDCFLDYAGTRYLKRERINLDKDGTIQFVDVFKSEGVLRYSAAELEKDPLLMKYSNWDIGNKLTTRGDSVVWPYKGIIVENDSAKQLIYTAVTIDRKLWLFVVAYSKHFHTH